jgi:NADPH:quinone reductase-like Zn-dependent oxidoreductase
MKAVVFREHGGPEKLSYEDVPEPEVGPLDVLVQVKAAGLNHLDLWLRKGVPAIRMTFPHISGCEGAGDVVGVGSAVKNIKVDDAVVVTPGYSCGYCGFCVRNQDSMCASYGMIGVKRPGCFAELVSAPAECIYPLPTGLTYEEAASIPLVFQTAWHMLVDRARIRHGEDVLVLAAGSGVGIAAIQIAKLFTARVYAAASTSEKLARAKELGADFLINYAETDFAEEIRKLTNKRGVDIVFEHTGADTWGKSILSAARYGRIVTCGATSGSDAKTDLRYIYSRQLTILGSYMGGKRDLLEVFRYIKERKLKPVIDSQFPLQKLREAEEKMADRNVFGKIILKP